MNVDGKENGFSIANDQQFEEICKLMDEYYGINQKKILNKYEVWKNYIKTLKMKKRFEERTRDSTLPHEAETSKKESKKEMIQRYTAFLSKLWFSRSDPFLKNKYKEFFEGSEVKWGPNMMFKNLENNSEQIKFAKGLIEKRLDCEFEYSLNNLAPSKMSSTPKKCKDKSYEEFLQLKHKDM